jgi:hypothetical protein
VMGHIAVQVSREGRSCLYEPLTFGTVDWEAVLGNELGNTCMTLVRRRKEMESPWGNDTWWL